MKILIVGAGVIGTVYGAHLAAAGNHISVLSHGRRTDEVAAGGLSARDVLGGGRVGRGGKNCSPEVHRTSVYGVLAGRCCLSRKIRAQYAAATFAQVRPPGVRNNIFDIITLSRVPLGCEFQDPVRVNSAVPIAGRQLFRRTARVARRDYVRPAAPASTAAVTLLGASGKRMVDM
jgi:hypothetical protein